MDKVNSESNKEASKEETDKVIVPGSGSSGFNGSLRLFIANVTDHYLTAFAAQSAYFTVLSFFPFVMSLIMLVQFFPLPDSEIEDMILSIIPSALSPYLAPIISETITTANGTGLSISILVTLWAASKGTMSLKNGFNTINGYYRSRNYIIVRLKCTGFTLIFTAVIIVVAGTLVFGNGIFHLLTSKYAFLKPLETNFSTIRTIAVILVLMLFFVFFYRFLPDSNPEKRNTIMHCLPGAALSTLGWVVISMIFSLYIDNFKNYTVMYGSLTGIIMALLWLYACLFIMFLGAELNHVCFGVDDSDSLHIPI